MDDLSYAAIRALQERKGYGEPDPIYQIVPNMSQQAMRDLLRRHMDYWTPEDTNKHVLRATVIAGYEYGLLKGSDIRRMGEDRDE